MTPDLSTRIRFILRLAEGLHYYGAPAYRLERALTIVAQHLRLDAQFFATPTAIMCSFLKEDGEEISRLVRTEPGEINLQKLSDVDEIADQVVAGTLAASDGIRALEEVRRRAPIFPAWASVCAYGLAAGSFSIFLKAQPIEISLATLCGLFVGGVTVFANSSPRFARLSELLAALACSLLVQGIQFIWPEASPALLILSGLLVLFPGLALTVALSELAMNQLVAGSTRLMQVLIIFFKLIFGVFAGATLIPHSNKVSDIFERAEGLGTMATLGGLLVIPIAFTVLFLARKKDIGWITIASWIAFGVARFGTDWFGLGMGTFLAGWIVGTASNAFARFFHRPASIFLLPGLLLIVPGSLGYRSFEKLFSGQLMEGLGVGSQVIYITIAIVAGLLVGNITLTPRRSL